MVTGTGILVGRGMDAEEVIDDFTAVRRRYPDRPALFHGRYATHGAVSIDNCHPFRLGRDRRTVLAHNGVLPRRVRPAPYDPRSDTRMNAAAGEAYCVCRHQGDTAVDGMPVWGDWIWVGSVTSGATPGFYHCASPTG
ncbi:class II glutamine amidotransferase [Nocardia sp. NPDC059239]|uniref:class II glutamine amidotransferase n=1 Tax=Nocardia sp. NPDC059239 TaxID=3346785 RepID=UPI003674A280